MGRRSFEKVVEKSVERAHQKVKKESLNTKYLDHQLFQSVSPVPFGPKTGPAALQPAAAGEPILARSDASTIRGLC